MRVRALTEMSVINKEKVLIAFRGRVRRQKLYFCKRKFWIFHHDNSPAHYVLFVKAFIVKYDITVLDHSLYSCNLVPCDFFLVPPRSNQSLKGQNFTISKQWKQKRRRFSICWQKPNSNTVWLVWNAYEALKGLVKILRWRRLNL